MVTINGKKISDYGYFINLDKRTDRLEKILGQFKDLKINNVKRFSAVTNMSSGPLNCKMSHYKIYEEFLKTDGEVLLVLEDDCLFLDNFKINYEIILNDIYKTKWDLFWLGCRNRRMPIKHENNTYKVSSVSHTQSYLIKRNVCKHILENYPINNYVTTSIDELLCLMIYGYEVVRNPKKFGFYELENPLSVLPNLFTSLCYNESLTTQYESYSDLWNMNADYENYLKFNLN